MQEKVRDEKPEKRSKLKLGVDCCNSTVLGYLLLSKSKLFCLYNIVLLSAEPLDWTLDFQAKIKQETLTPYFYSQGLLSFATIHRSIFEPQSQSHFHHFNQSINDFFFKNSTRFLEKLKIGKLQGWTRSPQKYGRPDNSTTYSSDNVTQSIIKIG